MTLLFLVTSSPDDSMTSQVNKGWHVEGVAGKIIRRLLCGARVSNDSWDAGGKLLVEDGVKSFPFGYVLRLWRSCRHGKRWRWNYTRFFIYLLMNWFCFVCVCVCVCLFEWEVCLCMYFKNHMRTISDRYFLPPYQISIGPFFTVSITIINRLRDFFCVWDLF